MKIYITLILSICFFLFPHSPQAQQAEKCGTMALLQQHLSEDPGLAARMQASETRAAQWKSQFNPNARGGLITIPVVVHVLYKNASQNISDAQIQSQIDVLNADYRRRNSDTSKTRPMFAGIVADPEIEFCLASRDPNGVYTNGITRTSTTGGQLFGFFSPLSDDAKSSATGGIDPWPADQYLNIWVCDLLPIVLGYAQFPGDNPATDGVVIGFSYFGTTGTVSAPYNRGRTTVHEVGHWLGLRHIWGDGDCTLDDFVDDTPESSQANQTQGCDYNANSCIDTTQGPDLPDMVENYMDYSEDSCMNSLTLGQKTRMWSFINTDRLPIQTSQGCQPGIAGLEDGYSQGAPFELFPNPGQDHVQLIWNSESTGFESIRLLNVLGEESLLVSSILNGQTVELNLEKVQAGIYFIEVSSQGKRYKRKMIINR